jgi:hypothetical protein
MTNCGTSYEITFFSEVNFFSKCEVSNSVRSFTEVNHGTADVINGFRCLKTCMKEVLIAAVVLQVDLKAN